MLGVHSSFQTVSSDGLNYNRLHPSALPLSFRFENYGKYFILSIALLDQIGKKCIFFYLAVRRSLSRLLFGVASTPALVLRRVAPAPGLVRRVAPAPGLVNPALLPAVTLRSPRRYFQILRYSAVSSILLPYFYSILHKTTLSQGPRLEDRRPSRRPSRNPLAERVQLGLKPGD